VAMSSTHLQDLLEWLAVAATSRVVAKVHDDKLDRPTPCTEEPATRALSARGFRSGCARPEARSS
jgi:hypothetical protein